MRCCVHIAVLLSLLLFVASMSCACAQEGRVRPFSHLAASFEVGLTGVGVELAAPLHGRVTVRAGVAALPLRFNARYDIDFGEGASSMDAIVAANPAVMDALRREGLPVSSRDLVDEVDFKARLGLVQGKLLVDCYPFRQFDFYVSAGAYFDNGTLFTLTGSMPDEVMQVTDAINGALPDGQRFVTAVAVGDDMVAVDGQGRIDVTVTTWKVKPYVGIGFGRAVPRRRLGCQFDLGVMFQGKPSLASHNAAVWDVTNTALESNGVTDILGKASIYPVLSLKLTGRIF